MVNYYYSSSGSRILTDRYGPRTSVIKITNVMYNIILDEVINCHDVRYYATRESQYLVVRLEYPDKITFFHDIIVIETSETIRQLQYSQFTTVADIVKMLYL